jgi:hypothetical protein
MRSILKATILLALAGVACGENADPSIASQVIKADSEQLRSFVVTQEDASSRCERKVGALIKVAEKHAAPVSHSKLSPGPEATLRVAAGDAHFSCFPPSGHVEYFHLSRMAGRRAVAQPVERDFVDAARHILSDLDASQLLSAAEVGEPRYAPIEAGDDDTGTGRSTIETMGARVTFPRVLNQLPVHRNFVSIGLDHTLKPYAIKIAWVDVQPVEVTTPARLTPSDALRELGKGWPSAPSPQVGLAYLAGKIMEAQDYVEPWYLFSADGRTLSAATPAIDAKGSIEGFAVVEETRPVRAR